MENKKSRSMIFGEYLRNVCYGRKGGIEPPEKEIEGLEKYVVILPTSCIIFFQHKKYREANIKVSRSF